MNPPYDYTTIGQIKTGLAERGYSAQDLVLDGKYFTRFTAPTGQSWLTSNAHISYPFTSSTARRISIEKNIAYDLAASVGVAVPRTLRVDPANIQSNDIVDFLPFAPLIVKPNDASLSNGLTRDVATKPALLQAIQLAARVTDSVLVQNQCQGEEIRFVVLNGKVDAALLRQTPQLRGNGHDTVQQLLEAENAERAGLRMQYLTYPRLTDAIVDLSTLDENQVLAKGEVLELGKSTMIRGGASVYDITDKVDGSYVAIVEKLAGSIGQGFVVVDMLVQDYTQEQTADNYVFLEFNMAPVLKLFYSCRDGRQYDILKRLVPMIDEAITYTRSNTQ